MANKITPKGRSPLREIPLNLERDSREEMIHAIYTYAYSRRIGHIQFNVQFDKSKRASPSSLYFKCPNPQCTWRVECSISRALGSVGKTTVTKVVPHRPECMGSVPVPDINWLSRHSILSSCALRARSNAEVLSLAATLGLSVSRQIITRLKKKVKAESVVEYNLTFGVIESWLKEFCHLNPGSQYEFQRNETTKQFEHCFLLLPCLPILENSFLGTLMLDCGFSVDPSRRTSQCYVLTLGDRESRNNPIAIGFKPTEDAEGYV